MPLNGFDVSHHQGDITWPNVNLADVYFCFIKATDGVPTDTDTGVDDHFAENWAGADSIKILRGAYHFFRPARPVAAQVANFTAQVGMLNLQDLPPVLDLEIPTDDPTAWSGIDPSQAVAMALDWVTRVQALLSRKAIVYMSPDFYRTVLGADAGGLKNYPLWIAQYTDASDPDALADWNTWQFWQYSRTGSVAGIGTVG